MAVWCSISALIPTAMGCSMTMRSLEPRWSVMASTAKLAPEVVRDPRVNRES